MYGDSLPTQNIERKKTNKKTLIAVVVIQKIKYLQ